MKKVEADFVHILLSGQTLYRDNVLVTVCHPNFWLSNDKMYKVSVMIDFLSGSRDRDREEGKGREKNGRMGSDQKGNEETGKDVTPKEGV